ncbi:MAG: hypothetical protein KKC18_12335, partial [Chloroflexi bacterium]|nr:hypothetical protein [Chloroflexota bacterium]
MSDILKALQRRHREKLDQLQHGEADEALLDGIQLLIADLRQAGVSVAAPAERGQLRALMHFWGNVVYDRTEAYPDTTLHPPDPKRAIYPVKASARSSPPSWVWTLVGGAAVIIIAVGLVTAGQAARPDGPPPAEVAVPFLRHIAVGERLNSNGALEMASDTFCLNTFGIVAEVALEGLEPETEWRWEVKRSGEVVAEQPAAPWDREAKRATIRILTGDPEGVAPGQYELLVYAGERVAGTYSFQVLDAAPRAFNPRVTDVPEQTEAAPDESA